MKNITATEIEERFKKQKSLENPLIEIAIDRIYKICKDLGYIK